MTITIGQTYTVVQPEPDPTCDTRSCELHQPDTLSPWLPITGKQVTVTETGLLYKNIHPAVRVATGPIDWHPRVMITLTDDQVRALGIEPNIASAYLISGYVMAADSSDAPITGVTWPDEFTFDFAYQSMVEIPRQPTQVIPVCCLRDNTTSPQDRRRENQLRRLAKIHGLKLKKMRGGMASQSTGPYLLVDATFPMRAVAGNYFGRIGISLDEIEAALHKQSERQS